VENIIDTILSKDEAYNLEQIREENRTLLSNGKE
jgi:hypothetical protein